MKKASRYTFPALIAVLCWLLYTYSTDMYMYSDNVDVALVINGYFGNPLCQYQHPLFCLFVNVLSGFFPSIDMYNAVVHGFIFFELIILINLLTGSTFIRQPKEWKMADYAVLALSVMICAFLSAGLNLWRANYTIQAGSFLFIGWLVLFKKDTQQKHTLTTVISTLYVATGYMLRKETGLLFVPFVMLYMAERVLTAQNRMVAIQQLVHYFLPPCLCLLALILSQVALNATEPYVEANRYNAARTAMVDFPVKEWNEEDVAFVGISHMDYTAAENWFFADTDIMKTDYLERMAAAGRINKYHLNPEGFLHAFQDMWRIVAKTDVYMSVMAVICILLAVWNMIFQRSWWSKSAALFAVIGAFIIMLYFAFRGRAPLRVWQPVLFGVLFSEMCLMFKCVREVKAIPRGVLLFLLFIVFYYSSGQVIAHIEFHDKPQNAFTGRVGAEESVYEKTLQSDDLYIWPNWHATIPKEFGWKMGKLPTRRVLEHHIPLGDWTYGQPYYTEFLERIGHPNPIRDLVEKDNVYIMSNSQYIVNFLREHYGDDIELAEAGEVNGTKAYRVIKGNVSE